MLIGMLISFIGFAMAWAMYDYKLVLILVVILWGNNLEQVGKGR